MIAPSLSNVVLLANTTWLSFPTQTTWVIAEVMGVSMQRSLTKLFTIWSFDLNNCVNYSKFRVKYDLFAYNERLISFKMFDKSPFSASVGMFS